MESSVGCDVGAVHGDVAGDYVQAVKSGGRGSVAVGETFKERTHDTSHGEQSSVFLLERTRFNYGDDLARYWFEVQARIGLVVGG
jgi:hypothetical protein